MWPRSLQTGTTTTSSPPHGRVPFVWYQGGGAVAAAGRVTGCEFEGGGLVPDLAEYFRRRASISGKQTQVDV